MSRSDFVVWVWLDKHTLTPLYPSLNIVWRDIGRTWLEHSANRADQYYSCLHLLSLLGATSLPMLVFEQLKRSSRLLQTQETTESRHHCRWSSVSHQLEVVQSETCQVQGDCCSDQSIS